MFHVHRGTINHQTTESYNSSTVTKHCENLSNFSLLSEVTLTELRLGTLWCSVGLVHHSTLRAKLKKLQVPEQ